MDSARFARRLRQYFGEVINYWREAVTLHDFVALMRVRLSQSKLGWLACPRPVCVTVRLNSFGAPIYVRSHATDISVLGELVISEAYASAANSVTSCDSIVDLGANTGLAARWLLHRFPNASIVCVEPHPGNVSILRLNLACVGTRATVLPACVGASARRVRLETTNGEFAFRMRELLGEDDVGDADVITMADVLRSTGTSCVDLLKCDIEGAEQEIFEDCDGWVDRIGSMVVECHAPYTASALRGVLEQRGVRYEFVDLMETPDFGCEVVTLQRLQRTGLG